MKNRFLVFLLVFLPLSVLADQLYYCPSIPQYSGTTSSFINHKIGTNDFVTVQLGVANYLHGVRIDSRTGYPYGFGNNDSSTTQNQYNFIVSCDTGLYITGYQYTTLNTLDSVCYNLWLNGFSSPNIVFQAQSGNFVYFNIHSLAALSEALCSTNTFYRSQVINGLSSLSSDVRQLVLDSSSALSSLSSIDSRLSSVVDSVSSLSSIETNSYLSASSLSSISSNVYSLSSSVSSNLNSVSSSVDSFSDSFRNLHAFGLSTSSSLESSLPSVLFHPALLSFYDPVLQRLNTEYGLDEDDSDSSARRFAFSRALDPLLTDQLRAFLFSGNSDYLNSPSQAADYISSRSSAPITNSLASVNSSLSTIHSSVGALHSSVDLSNTNLSAIGRSLSYSSDNPLLSMFAGDPSAIIDSLRQSHTDPNDPLNPDNPDSPFNPRNPNFVGGGGGFQGAFTTNNVVKPLSNAVHRAESTINSNLVAGADNISSNVVASADNLKKLMQKIEEILKNLTTPDPGDSIAASVKIVGPLDLGRVAVELPWGPGDLFNVDVFSNIIVDAFSSFNPDFVITNTAPDYTELLEQIVSNTAPYRLWTDYESLMNNDWSAVSAAALDDSFKDSISDFDLIGSDFWHYFTYVSGRQACDVHSLASIFTNVLPLVDFINHQDFGTDDKGNSKSMFDVGSEVISSYPSRSAIEDYISQVTNSSHSVSASTNELSRLASSTNTVHDILGRYFLDKGSAPPSSLVFFKLSAPDGGYSKDFEIPLSDRQELWSTLRASITVVFTLVNLILLPKFLLMVFRLFMRLFNRSLPFLDSKE